MKKIIVALWLVFLAGPAFAQIIETDPSIGEAMQKLVKGHDESSGVREIKAKIEAEYDVNCTGGSSTVFPDITKRVTYKASCAGKTPINLKITSKFSASKVGFEYNVKGYSVSF